MRQAGRMNEAVLLYVGNDYITTSSVRHQYRRHHHHHHHHHHHQPILTHHPFQPSKSRDRFVQWIFTAPLCTYFCFGFPSPHNHDLHNYCIRTSCLQVAQFREIPTYRMLQVKERMPGNREPLLASYPHIRTHTYTHTHTHIYVHTDYCT